MMSFLGILLSLLGGWHRAFDTLGMMLPLFAPLCLVGAIRGKGLWLRRFLGVGCLLAIALMLPSLRPQEPGRDLTVYAKNLLATTPEFEQIVADILASDVDVVMLQEVSDQNRGILQALAPQFPHSQLCRFSSWSGIAVLARQPPTQEGQCSSERAAAALQIETEDGPVWMVSVHVPWPWPSGRKINEKALHELLETLEGQKVVGGDFNILPWTGRIRRIARQTQTRLAGPTRPSIYAFGVAPIPIDHVLAPGGGTAEFRPRFGSDHRGLVAKVSLD